MADASGVKDDNESWSGQSSLSFSNSDDQSGDDSDDQSGDVLDSQQGASGGQRDHKVSQVTFFADFTILFYWYSC